MNALWKFVAVTFVIIAAALSLGRRLPAIQAAFRRSDGPLSGRAPGEERFWCASSPASGERSVALPLQQGLTILTASEVAGLSGAFRKNQSTVFFLAQRGGVNDEYFFLLSLLGDTTPKYSVHGALLDRNCFPFVGQASGISFERLGRMTREEATAHQEDMRLTREAIDALTRANVSPRLDPELTALRSMGSGFFGLPASPLGSASAAGIRAMTPAVVGSDGAPMRSPP